MTITAGAIDVGAVGAFQRHRAGEFLWPRTDSEFAQVVENRGLFVVKEGDAVVGMCYVKDDDDARWEFGGVLIDETFAAAGSPQLLGGAQSRSSSSSMTSLAS